MSSETRLVRLSPYDKSKGQIMRQFSVMSGNSDHRTFMAGKWYRVGKKLADFLAEVRQKTNDPRSQKAFVVVMDQEEAKEVIRAEKEAARKGVHQILRKKGPDLSTDDLKNDPEEVDPLDDDDFSDDDLEKELSGEVADQGEPVEDLTSDDPIDLDGDPEDPGVEDYDLDKLDSMTKSDLLDIAQDHGIEVKRSWTKEKIRDVIVENLAE